MISREQNRQRVEEVYEPCREKLGNDRFEAMVDELEAASWDALMKLDAYPWTDGLDGNVAEKRQIQKDRTTKVLLIKQKYGV
jgi:hypothetical protein